MITMTMTTSKSHLHALTVVVLAVAASALGGCSTGAVTDAFIGESCNHGAAIQLLADDSGSTTPQRVAGGPYETSVMQVLADAARSSCGATVTATRISGNSVAAAPVFTTEFTKTVSGNPTLGRDARSRGVPTLRPSARQLLHRPVGMPAGSDILGAMDRAAQSLHQVQGGHRRVLVVLTDGALLVRGVQGYNVYKAPPATASERGNFIRQLRHDRDLPDLHGVDVYLGGVAVGVGSRRTAKAVVALWQALVPAAGGTLKNSGPVLDFTLGSGS